MLGRVLEGEGYGVQTAASAAEALDIAASGRINLVLLDLNLPGKSGWDVVEWLATEQPLVPVIIVTARSNQLFPALASGVGALLEKPPDFPTLLQTVCRLLAESAEAWRSRVAGRPSDFVCDSVHEEDNLI